MKTITFKNGMAIITEDGQMPYMERVGTSLSAEEVKALLTKHGFETNDVASDCQTK